MYLINRIILLIQLKMRQLISNSNNMSSLANFFLTLLSGKGAFNNYLDKKRCRGVVSRKSTLDHMNKGYVVCKMSIIVHSRGVDGQNWVKFGLHS